MALANWEGQAFRNGEHWHEGCEFGWFDQPGDKFGYHVHAAVGTDKIKVAIRKDFTILAIKNEEDVWELETSFEGRREIDGYIAIGIMTPGPGVGILIDPDGVVWTVVGAYEAYDNWCEDE